MESVGKMVNILFIWSMWENVGIVLHCADHKKDITSISQFDKLRTGYANAPDA